MAKRIYRQRINGINHKLDLRENLGSSTLKTGVSRRNTTNDLDYKRNRRAKNDKVSASKHDKNELKENRTNVSTNINNLHYKSNYDSRYKPKEKSLNDNNKIYTRRCPKQYAKKKNKMLSDKVINKALESDDIGLKMVGNIGRASKTTYRAIKTYRYVKGKRKSKHYRVQEKYKKELEKYLKVDKKLREATGECKKEKRGINRKKCEDKEGKSRKESYLKNLRDRRKEAKLNKIKISRTRLKTSVKSSIKRNIKESASNSIDNIITSDDSFDAEAYKIAKASVEHSKNAYRGARKVARGVDKGVSKIKTLREPKKIIQSKIEKRQQTIKTKQDIKATKRKIKTLRKARQIKQKQLASTQAVKFSSAVSSAVTKIVSAIIGKVGSVGAIILCIVLVLGALFGVSVGGIMPMLTVPIADEEDLSYLVDELEKLDNKANKEIRDLEDEYRSSYDRIDYEFLSNKTYLNSNNVEYISLLAVYTEQDISRNSLGDLQDIHRKSYKYTTREDIEIEVYYKNVVDSVTGETVRKRFEEEINVLIISVIIYEFDDLINKVNFDEGEKELAYMMLENDFSDFYPNISWNKTGNGLSDDELSNILADLPNTTISREELRKVALTLVNYTTYELGGKANGSVEKPTSLDCSGFVAWVYDRAGITNSLQAGGTAYQWGITTPIRKDNLQVGDLGFMLKPEQVTSGYNHNGIYIGNGKWVESYGGYGVGITNGNVFKYYRKVVDFEEDEVE